MEPRAGLYCAVPIPAGADARPKGAAARSARDRPVVMINRPIKTRRLKKAELADDFFFMVFNGGSDIALRCLPRAFGRARSPYSFSFCSRSCSRRFAKWNTGFN